MSNTIVFGGSGQLGTCLKAVAEKEKLSDLLFLGQGDGDILNPDVLDRVFRENAPRYVINCAAYTAVDKAETDVDTARLINKTGPQNLSLLCKKYNVTLIHISTDFVFEGTNVAPLTEDAEKKPVNVYGLTKLEGERSIEQAWDQHFILRTSWLYSEYGNNFVKTMLRLGKEKSELSIIADQIGTPTYGIDLAKAILNIITSNSTQYGVYHYSNEGTASWYDFAKAIFDIAGIKIAVYPIATAQYPTPAARPKFSVMDKSKFKNTFNMNIPYWRDSLVSCINILEK